jgi:hypothetical protein
MKNTASKAILYDDHCPMCALYTQGFVKWGVLKPENRVAFTQASKVLSPESDHGQLDSVRSRHEIPLIDLHGGPTLYGIDAMVYLLGQRLPLIRKTMQLKPVYAFFRFLYALVSYNRRIMVPSSGPTATFDCTPLYHHGYRLSFIGYGIVLASLITLAFGQSVAGYWPIPGAATKMLLICGSGWVLQMGMAVLLLEKKAVDYLGHLSVLMIIGTLVLLPGMALSQVTQYQFPAIPAISIVISSGLMTWQHIRRVQHLGLSQWWTCTWFLSLQSTAAIWLAAFWFHQIA